MGSKSNKDSFRQEVVTFFLKNTLRISWILLILSSKCIERAKRIKIWQKIKKHYGPNSLLASQEVQRLQLAKCIKAGRM